MAALTLKSILGPRSANYPAVVALRDALGSNICVLDASGKILLGEPAPADPTPSHPRIPVLLDGITLGHVAGPAPAANALALLLAQLAAREHEGRSLAAEVLHLYREINLIEQLSEQLAALLNSPAVGRAALDQAQRLIPATHGVVLITNKETGLLEVAASFAPTPHTPHPTPDTHTPHSHSALSPTSPFTHSILDRGIGEIINDCSSDPRLSTPHTHTDTPHSHSHSHSHFTLTLTPSSPTPDPGPQTLDPSLSCAIAAPLRTGQSIVGVIALANTDPAAAYSAANLKLLNTIALQTAAAIEKSLLAAEMVSNARERAAIAAELHAASTVQQLLLQSASRPTPGFTVHSVYLPASEVGGDFFYVAPAPDGSITAIAGDVSGKGITAAMRVAMILGALRRETSHDPAQILHDLNETLLAVNDPSLAQLGFTTAVCVRIALDGHFTLANAGHVNPYQSGRELNTSPETATSREPATSRELPTPPALPLGLVPDQHFELVSGHLAPGQTLVLLSDGVPEARSSSGELYGFDRTQASATHPAHEIARRAQHFGQEDDITVLSLALAD
jgi:serine phosphatase RsbU (regulator of sigma subunit)